MIFKEHMFYSYYDPLVSYGTVYYTMEIHMRKIKKISIKISIF